MNATVRPLGGRGAALVALTLVVGACAAPDATRSPGATRSPVAPSSTPTDTREAVAYRAGSLPAFLAEDGRFTIFLSLLERDGHVLARLLGDPSRPFTLFVPTDEAFGSLSAAARADLDDASLVTGIVERHFLMRRLASRDFASAYLFTGMSRRMSRLALVVSGSRTWFGDARVVETDLTVAGGVVHVIDGVNLGPTPDRVPIP